MQFIFLTGFLPLAKESAQSGLNNPDCYDMDTSVHANLFGFIQSEVDDMLARARLEGKRESIREWYDCYRFGKIEEIYCPWSIMRYLGHKVNTILVHLSTSLIYEEVYQNYDNFLSLLYLK